MAERYLALLVKESPSRTHPLRYLSQLLIISAKHFRPAIKVFVVLKEFMS